MTQYNISAQRLVEAVALAKAAELHRSFDGKRYYWAGNFPLEQAATVKKKVRQLGYNARTAEYMHIKPGGGKAVQCSLYVRKK